MDLGCPQTRVLPKTREMERIYIYDSVSGDELPSSFYCFPPLFSFSFTSGHLCLFFPISCPNHPPSSLLPIVFSCCFNKAPGPLLTGSPCALLLIAQTFPWHFLHPSLIKHHLLPLSSEIFGVSPLWQGSPDLSASFIISLSISTWDFYHLCSTRNLPEGAVKLLCFRHQSQDAHACRWQFLEVGEMNKHIFPRAQSSCSASEHSLRVPRAARSKSIGEESHMVTTMFWHALGLPSAKDKK